MITYQRKAGTTDVSVVIRIIDAADGTPETAVTSATSGLDLEYRREGAAVVNLTESDLSALTDAHSDGGMLHIGAGYYRVDLPDAACEAGSAGVLVTGNITDMVVIGCYVQLDAIAEIAAETIASLPDAYQAKVWMQDDNGGTADRYACAFFVNSQPTFTLVDSATIQVVKAADGTDLVAETAMTEIGSTGMFRYDEATNRMVSGAAYIIIVRGSHGSPPEEIVWVQPMGRDSS